MRRGPLNVDQRVWAIEQYELLEKENAALRAWIDKLPPGMQPPDWQLGAPPAPEHQPAAQPATDASDGEPQQP
jgi:hypothetical protein